MMTSFRKGIALFIIIFCCSCAFHANNWNGSSVPGKNTASFDNFTGKETDNISLNKGDQLHLSYKVGMEKGTLDIIVQGKAGILWQKRFTGPIDSAEINLPVSESGVYKIHIIGKDARGSFDIGYKRLFMKKIQVKINKNIELFGLMMQLNMGEDLMSNHDTVMIDHKKSTWKDWYRLAFNNYRQYKRFSKSRMMEVYKSYSEKGFYDDFFIGLLLQVDEVPLAKLNETTDKDVIMAFSSSGNYLEAQTAAEKFLEEFNGFYRELDFDKYLAKNESYYKRIVTDVQKNIPSDAFLPAMEAFYQKTFDVYCLVPGFNIPTSMGFGKMNKNTHSIYNAFGPFTFQNFEPSDLRLGFDDPGKIQGLSVHEFGHSFVNPAIDKLPGKLIDSTAYLFTPIKEVMTKLSYPSWKICLYEHFVKAGEVILAENLGKKNDAEKMLHESVKAGFIYLPVIVSELKKYDGNRDVYRSYDDFVPDVVRKLRVR